MTSVLVVNVAQAVSDRKEGALQASRLEKG